MSSSAFWRALAVHLTGVWCARWCASTGHLVCVNPGFGVQRIGLGVDGCTPTNCRSTQPAPIPAVDNILLVRLPSSVVRVRSCQPSCLFGNSRFVLKSSLIRPREKKGEPIVLNLWGKAVATDCDGTSRRDFLKIGTLGLTGLSLSGLLRLRSSAAAAARPLKDTSVIWLWLGGGPTHIETFDPKMVAPAEFRSMVGAAKTSVPGVHIGGLLPEMAKRARRMAFVRSFAHGNSGHAGGTHFVMTGTDYPPADSGMPPIKPSIGSVAARVRGANNAQTGIPTYVRLAGLYADGPNWLGPAYAPFNVGGQAQQSQLTPGGRTAR